MELRRVCAWCRREEEHGTWTPYLGSTAAVTHTICPACARSLTDGRQDVRSAVCSGA